MAMVQKNKGEKKKKQASGFEPKSLFHVDKEAKVATFLHGVPSLSSLSHHLYLSSLIPFLPLICSVFFYYTYLIYLPFICKADILLPLHRVPILHNRAVILLSNQVI
jgi:hypothetical protein